MSEPRKWCVRTAGSTIIKQRCNVSQADEILTDVGTCCDSALFVRSIPMPWAPGEGVVKETFAGPWKRGKKKLVAATGLVGSN